MPFKHSELLEGISFSPPDKVFYIGPCLQYNQNKQTYRAVLCKSCYP